MLGALDATWHVLHDLAVPAAVPDYGFPPSQGQQTDSPRLAPPVQDQTLSHLLLSPHGLFPIRVRRRNGASVTVAADEVLVDGSPTDEVRLLRAQAEHLSMRLHRATGIRVIPRPILIFTGHASLAVFADPHDVHVLPAEALVTTLVEALDLALFVGHQVLDDDLVALLWAASSDPATWHDLPERPQDAPAGDGPAAATIPSPRPPAASEALPQILNPGAVPVQDVDAQRKPSPAAHALPRRVISLAPGGLAKGSVTQARTATTPGAGFGSGVPEREQRNPWETEDGQVLPIPARPRLLRGQANPTHVSDMGLVSRLGVGLIGVGVAAVTSMTISAPTSAAAFEPVDVPTRTQVQQPDHDQSSSHQDKRPTGRVSLGASN